MIYAIDGYGLTFEEVCGVADHEVATLVAGITPDNRMTEPTRHLKLREAIGLAPEVGQMVKLAEITAFAQKVMAEFTPADYLQYGQSVKHIVERHVQLIQAMSRLTAHASTAAVADSARESLVKIAHEVEEVRKTRTRVGVAGM